MPRGQKGGKKTVDKKQEKRLRRLEMVANAVEVKESATFDAAVSIPSTGLVVPLTDIAQGTLSVERIGDAVKIIDTEFQVEFNNPSNANEMYARFIIFRFDAIEPQTATLSLVDFLFPAQPRGLIQYQSPAGNIYNVQYKHSNKLLNVPGAIQIIHDTGPMHMDPNVKTTATKYWNLTRWRSRRAFKVQYTGAAVTDNSKGALYAMICASDPTATCNTYTRVMFIDP